MLQKLVKLMNGVLTVKSKPGEGSVFEFTLPLSVPDVADESLTRCINTSTQEKSKLEGMRVVLVDSNIVRQVSLFSFENENIFLVSTGGRILYTWVTCCNGFSNGLVLLTMMQVC